MSAICEGDINLKSKEAESNNIQNANPPHNEKERVDVDYALVLAGSFGKFQICTQLIMLYLTITIGYHFVLSFFIGNDPAWKCISSNSSEFCALNYGKEISSDSDTFYKRCKLERDEWTFVTPKSHSFVTEFDLVCEKTSLAAFVSASFFIGGFVGSMVSGTTADAWGRKSVLIVSLSLTIGSSIACTFITSIWQLCVLRAVLGASQVACFFTSFVFLSEFIPPKFRTISSNLFLMSLSASHMLIDLVAYFERNWRKMQRYASLPAILAFIVIYLLPESPRWLLASKRETQAKEVINKIARCNGKDLQNIELKLPDVPEEKNYSYLDLFRRWKLVFLNFSIGVLWTTVALLYYTIALESSNLGGNMYEAFVLSALADIPSYFVSSYTCNRFGRKKSNLGSILASGILVGSVALIPKSLSCRYVVNIVIVMFARFFAEMAFNGLYTWTFEIYPTILRSQGLSICVIFERIGLLSVPFLTTVLQSVSYILPFVFIFALSLVASAFGLILPETNKLPTREKYEDLFVKNRPVTTSDMGIDNEMTRNIEDVSV